MKIRTIAVLALLALALAGLNAYGLYTIGTPADVQNGTYNWPTGAFTDDATYHLIYSPAGGVSYQTWDSVNGWVAQTGFGSAGDTGPLLEKDPSGYLHLLYKSGASLMYANNKLGSWSTPVAAATISATDVSYTDGNGNPQTALANYSYDLAVDNSGSVHILWDETSGLTVNPGAYPSYKVLYNSSTDGGVTWPGAPIHDFGQRTLSVAGHDPNQHRSTRRDPFALDATGGTVRALLYGTTSGYVGYSELLSSSDNGATWNSDWTQTGASHQNGADEIVDDGLGNIYAFYNTVSQIDFRVFTGGSWSSPATAFSTAGMNLGGFGAAADREGTIWLSFAEQYAGGIRPPGYHTPFTYYGDSTSGMTLLEEYPGSQHVTYLFGIRPSMAIEDALNLDPFGSVWWVLDNNVPGVRGVGLDNVAFLIPEPSVALLFALGGWLVRRRRTMGSR